MTDSLAKFSSNIEQAKYLGSLFTKLQTIVTPVLDLSDLLRAEIVFAVSAFDYYIHQLVNQCMLEELEGTREISNGFKNFSLPIERILELKAGSTTWLDDEIKLRHSYKSFQSSRNVNEAIKLIKDLNVWEEVSRILAIDKENIKHTLDLIIDRRNKIAHEADMDPSFPNKRWAITWSMANDAVKYIVRIAQAIDSTIE